MDIMFERCAGIDVHKRTVVVCRLTRDVQGTWVAETQTFGTTTSELLRLSDWLTEGGCTPVGLESTGEFWKPVFNLLEGACEVWLLNAQPIKAMPGRKTDVKDAQWIAELLAHGLVRPSFIPPQAQPSASCAIWRATERAVSVSARPWSTGSTRRWKAPTSSWLAARPTSWASLVAPS